jgi:hypothetical protein
MSAPDKPTFEQIESFVLDDMSADDRHAFEQRMRNDPAFREEVELERENIRAIELGGLDRVMRQVRAEDSVKRDSSIHWSAVLKYAAVVALLLGGALWIGLRPNANERLFTEHFTPDPGLPVAMSATSDPAFADAMISYKEGKYAEARAKWAPLLQQEPMNDTLRYYNASAWLAEGDAAAAVPVLEGLAGDTATALRTKAQWFLFLAHVRAGEIAKAMAIDLDTNAAYGERVRGIKAQLAR